MQLSRSRSDPPKRVTIDTDGPTRLRKCPRTMMSRFPSPVYWLSTATHTLRNVSQFHVWTKTRIPYDTCSNPMLNLPRGFTELTTRDRNHGNILFCKIDWKQKSKMKVWNQYVNFRIRHVFYTERIQILNITSFHDQHLSKFTQLTFKENVVRNCYTRL